MTAALCDANVVVKWFHDEPGDETPAARRIAGGSEDGHVELKVLDLTYYELGDTVRRLGASGAAVAGVLEALHEVCGPGIATDRHHWAAVADVADQSGLSFSDAAYVVIADRHDLTLLTADEAMIRPEAFCQARTSRR